MTSVSSYLTLGSYAFATSVETFLSAQLAINSSHIAVNELVLAPGASIGPGTQTVNLRVDFSATPADSFSAAAVSARLSVWGSELHCACKHNQAACKAQQGFQRKQGPRLS